MLLEAGLRTTEIMVYVMTALSCVVKRKGSNPFIPTKAHDPRVFERGSFLCGFVCFFKIENYGSL